MRILPVQMFALHTKGKFIGQVILLIGIISVFEAFQQYYYIVTFDLAGTKAITPWMLLKGHAARWVIWGITAVVFHGMLNTFPADSQTRLVKILFLIIALVVLDVGLITVVSNWESVLHFAFDNLKGDFVFNIFQKGPIFMIAYLCLGIYTYFHSKTNALKLRMQSLIDARAEDELQYKELRNRQWTNDTQVLSVKVGKRIHLIPIEEIEWIQSDNYCVKVHTINTKSYTLRSSMKTMENLLPKNRFVRIHRSSIVNSDQIASLNLKHRPTLQLKSGKEVEVSGSRMADVRKVFNQQQLNKRVISEIVN